MKGILFVFGLFVLGSIQAQNNNGSLRKKLQFSTVEFSFASFAGSSQELTVGDYQTLMTQGGIPQNDVYGFQRISNSPAATRSIVNLGVGFDVRKKDGGHFFGHPQVLFGFSACNMTFNNDYFERNTRQIIDTIFIGSSPYPYRVDSISEISFSGSNRNSRFRLHAQVLWQTNPKYRFFVFAGFGLGVGITTAESWVDYSYSNKSRKEVIDIFGDVNSTYGTTYESTSRRVAAKPWTDMTLLATVGCDFRLGNAHRDKIWRYLHFFFQFSPTLWMNSTSGVSPRSSVGFMNTWGLKFRLVNW
jgi:hypothetical protein